MGLVSMCRALRAPQTTVAKWESYFDTRRTHEEKGCPVIVPQPVLETAILGSIEFKVLGGLVLRAHGRLLMSGTPKQRTLTSMLLVRTNSMVPFHDITEELSGALPPKSAAANLRTYAARLRASLPPTERYRLIVRPSGYQLHVQPDELDLKVFEDKIVSGCMALETGAVVEALRHLESGLALWRGPPL